MRDELPAHRHGGEHHFLSVYPGKFPAAAAGVSYEFIRLAGKSENPVVLTLSKPGLWLQKLTTREPEDDMVEVAIAAVEAVFDWRKFLAGADGADCKVAGTPAAENAYE